MKSGEKKNKGVTIHDIAEKLKIATSTVSRALNDHPKINDKTKEKVWSMAKKMGYYHNIPIYMTKDTFPKVALIVPEYNHYYSEIIKGAQNYFQKKSVFLYTSSSRNYIELEKRLLEESVELGVKGIILSIFTNKNENNLLFDSIPKKFPIVLINKYNNDSPINTVVPDVFNGIYSAVNHLISMGCENIGFFGGILDNPFYEEMKSGYESAISTLGKPIRNSHVYISDFSQEEIAYGIDKIINQKTPPEGLIVGDQVAAQQIIAYLRSVGISVPQDMLIVGFGNEKFSAFVSPTLSSVQISGKNIGKLAAKQLYKSFYENDKEPKTIVEQAKLIIRASSMKLKN